MNKPHLPPFEVREVPLARLAEERKNWAFREYRIEDLWRFTKGEKVRVCVLDTGLPTHKDISVRKSINFSDDPDTDKNGHSTWVSGCIKASGGFLGIAPECDLYIGKVLNNDGSGDWGWLEKGLEWALEEECHIVNISAGGDYPGEKIQPLLKEMANKAIVVVCAAGNEKDIHIFPANDKHTLAIGAVDKEWKKALFSNFGPRLVVTAPGVELLGCWLNNGYAKASGTSMATPIVSGVLALESARHRLNLTEAIVRFIFTSKDIGQYGWDPGTGWGYLKPHKFLHFDTTQKKLTIDWFMNLFVFIIMYFIGDEEFRVQLRRALWPRKS